MSASVDFRHVVMTRFNLATPGRESAIRKEPGWLARRFDLFERYCLPGMAGQIRKDFEWIVYFNIDTPDEFRKKIDEYRGIYPFIPYYTPLFDAGGWPRSIAECLDVDAPWLLTTRLDNDDALAPDFTERLHAAVATAAPVRSAFNFTNGYVVGDGRVYSLAHRSNAFVSLLEPWDGSARTVMSIQHLDIERHCPLVQIDGPGAWIQMVHGGNVSNKIRGRRVRSSALAGRAPSSITDQLVDATNFEIGVENFLLTPLRDARDGLVDFARRRRRFSASRRDGHVPGN